MARRSWTDSEYEFVLQGRQDGLSIAELALKVGRSEASVRNKLRDENRSPVAKKKFSPKEQKTIEDASYDFENSLLKAELKAMKQKVKEAGKMRVEGKEYNVQDGDVMHFRFNV